MARPITLWLGVALLTSPVPGLAQLPTEAGEQAPAPKAGVSSILKTLDWGVSPEQVIELHQSEVQERYADRIKAARGDTFAIDRILRDRKAEVDGVRDTLVKFGPGRSGFEASIVADEFEAGAGESMLRIDDASAQRYYFFKDGALWKIYVAYNTSVARSVSFADFVKQVTAKNGRPQDTRWSTPLGGTRTLSAATWSDALTHLEAEDRSEFFGTFTMRFVEKNAGLALDKRREAKAARPASEPSDGMLADIMGGADGTETADVVDQLTGTAHTVDMSKGRPKEAVIRRDPPAKGKPTRTQPGKSRPKAEPRPTPSGGDDVIIY